MNTFINVENISSYALAADIHQRGGNVKIESENSFKLQLKHFSLSVRIVNGKYPYIAFSLCDILISEAGSVDPIKALIIINNHAVAEFPAATAALSNFSEK